MLEKLISWLGLGLCHQLPERSYFGGGLQAPVCARDTGIYVGFVIALALLGALHRGARPTGFPRIHVWLTMASFLALMGWDGITSYAGVRETTNALRAVTGLGVGFSAAVIVYPMLNDELWLRRGHGRVLEPAWRFFAWLGALPLAWAAIHLLGPRMGAWFPLVISGSILITLSAINLIVVAMLPWFDRKAQGIGGILAPGALALTIAFAEVALAAQMRLWMLGLVASL